MTVTSEMAVLVSVTLTEAPNKEKKAEYTVDCFDLTVTPLMTQPSNVAVQPS